MVSPFLIEKVYGYSPVITGYSSLASGMTLMAGGIISKSLIKKSLFKKINTAIGLQFFISVLMSITAFYVDGFIFLLSFTLLLHLLSGFIFNNVYAYSLQRFTTNAGIANGLTGGGVYIVSSAAAYGLITVFDIKSLKILSQVNVSIVVFLWMCIYFFKKSMEGNRGIPIYLLKSKI